MEILRFGSHLRDDKNVGIRKNIMKYHVGGSENVG